MRLSKWLSVSLAAVLLSFALANSAGATNYYVADSLALTPKPATFDTNGVWPGLGRSNGTGTRILPFRAIRQANAVVAAVDTVYVYGLSIADTADVETNKICPATAGTHALHITYIGRFHQNDWGQHLPIPSILDTVSYITISGFRVKDNITLEHRAGSGTEAAFYARATPPKQPNSVYIDSCRAQRIQFFGVDSCTVTHNIFDNSGTAIAQKYPTVEWRSNDGKLGERLCGSSSYQSTGNCVSYNHANEFSYNVVEGGHVENVSSSSQRQFFVMRGRSNLNLIKQNRFSATFDGTNANVSGRVLYYAPNNTFLGNRWTFESDHPVAASANAENDQWTCSAISDSSSGNVFRRDTILAGVASYNRIGFKLVSTGSYGHGTMRSTSIDSCFFRTTGNAWVDDDFSYASIAYSVFDANTSPALWFRDYDMLDVVLNHNTFFTRRLGPALRLGVLPGQNDLVMSQNIFYSDSVQAAAEGSAANTAECYPGTSYPVVTVPANMGHDLYSDRNLYFSRMGKNTVPTKDKLAVSNATFASAIGSASCWSNVYQHDIASLYGDPGFADTTWAAFSPRFAYGTLADSSDFLDYAGAYAPTDPTTLPDSIYAMDGAIAQPSRLGAPVTRLYSYIQPDSGGYEVRWIARSRAAAGDTLTQTDFDLLIAAGGDSVYSEFPELSVPHQHTEYYLRTRTISGTHSNFWLQGQQVDVWGNKSRFSFREVAGP